MPIVDMHRYDELARSGDAASAAERPALLQEHDAAVEAQIALLKGQREHLQEKIHHYRTALSIASAR
jgi:hypothetical protein